MDGSQAFFVRRTILDELAGRVHFTPDMIDFEA
jgi:hypothetical protein